MQLGAAGTRKTVVGMMSPFRAPRRFNSSGGLRILYLKACLEDNTKNITYLDPFPSYLFHVVDQARSLLCYAPNVFSLLSNRRFG